MAQNPANATSVAQGEELSLAATLPGPPSDEALAPTLDHRVTPPRPEGGAIPPELSLLAVPGTIPKALDHWDRYEILRPLGQGGMGTVFLARDNRLGRQVALKFLRLPSPDAAERMLQEARAQARLDHSGICKVFEVGEFQAQPYIAMEYLDGQPLHLALRRLTLEQKILLLHQISLAVHTAHSQGILHRDLKPANIMVCTVSAEGASESPGGLRPVLMDFGLARDSLGPQRLTQTGAIMGTPHYMAPEQARGQARHLDRRADVYSLGAILYELLTGKPPFDAATEVELLLAVLNQDPVPPRQLEPSLPADLEVITLKCLRKEPEQRYDSALALAEDLQRYLHSEPIVARPASTLYRLRRLAVRHRAFVLLGLVLFILSCAMVGLLFRGRARERQYQEHAHARQRLATELGQASTRMNLFLRIAYGLPVHDLRREQAIVRHHLEELEQQMLDSNSFLHGTLESAVGEGHLVLREYDQAVEHLQRAVQLGERTPSVHLVLGQALGRLYEQRASEVKQRLELEQARPQLQALRQQLLVPARRELQEGQSAELASPAYIQALLHYYAGDSEYDQALKYARQAQQEAPWLIEPLDLELRIIVQRYVDAVKRGGTPSASNYQEVHDTILHAIEVARSYPEFYRSFSDFAIISIRSALWQDRPCTELQPLYTEAIAHAKTAVELLPESGDVKDELGEIYSSWSYVLVWGNKDPRPIVERGLFAIEETMRHPPARSRSYAARSRMYLALSKYEEFLGLDPEPSGAKAVQDARRAATLDPNNSDTANLLLVGLSRMITFMQWKNRPLEKESEELLKVAIAASELRPDIPLPTHNLAETYLQRATWRIEHGRDPGADLANAERLLKELRSRSPDFALAQLTSLGLEALNIQYLLSRNQDVRARAREFMERVRAGSLKYPKVVQVPILLTESYLSLADSEIRQGQSPLLALDDGIRALAALDFTQAEPGKYTVLRSELRLKKADWLQRKGQSPETETRAVISESEQLAEVKGMLRVELSALRARALRLHAQWLATRGQGPAALSAVQSGLEVCAAARKSASGGLWYLESEEGALNSVKAQLLGDRAERARTAAQAVAILEPLLRDRPPLAFDLGRYLEAAQRLTAPEIPQQ